MQQLILTSFEQAITSLREAVDAEMPQDSLLLITLHRDAVIQRFEYTFELAWKMMKRSIELEAGRAQVDDLFSKKDLFRRAMEAGLISDPERWFAYLRARNETSHAYDKKKAERVYGEAMRFVTDAEDLLGRLKKMYE